MSGPEHYREAERLLAKSLGPLTLAAAQVHATLALAAATADAQIRDYYGPDARYDAPEWSRVLYAAPTPTKESP